MVDTVSEQNLDQEFLGGAWWTQAPSKLPGWWDFPVPAYIEDDRQDEYWATRAKEQHL